MTGEPGRRSRDRLAAVPRTLAAALGVTLSVGSATAVLGAALTGRPAAAGAVLGTAMVCLFFGLGALALHATARVAPALWLLVALLTYTLQVVLVGGAFLGLSRSGALDAAVERRWLGGAVILCTLTWLAVQVTAGVRSRRPLYDPPPRQGRDG